MAGEMRATPRNSVLGLFSDIVNLPLQYMSSPERTQQMQGTAQFLYGTGIPNTLERMSYGDSLFSGGGGLGGTTRMRPETVEALMNVAPFAPVAGRVAGRMIKATEGMPVGMGIKDVSPKIGINVNQGGSSFADKIISGEKKFETRESDSLRSYVGKRVGIIRTGEGKAKAIGDVTLGEPIVVSSPEEFAKLRDLHLVPEGSKFDIKQGGVKYLYPIENPVPYGVEKDVAKYGIVSRKILGEPDTLEKALYPQQAALDLAQQRAALPVEQGGLGLPRENTPMDRAKALGYPMGKGFDVSYEMGHSPIGTVNTLSKPTSPRNKAEIIKAELEQMGIPVVGETAGTGSTYLKIPGNPYDISPKYGGGQSVPIETIRFSTHSKREFGKPTNRPDLDSFIADVFPKNGNSLEEARKAIDNLIQQGGIRSRFAAFDPFRKDVATAIAMGVALPDLLAQPINQVQPTYETTPMYTDPFGNTIGESIR